jgi:glyoxylase-like metal-dependent hydrolase (beta-lactamase superfamily II)
MNIQHFFDPDTYTLTYVVSDEKTKDSVIIDPVLDFDPASGKVNKGSMEKVINFVKEHGLTVKGILETHAHADHLSSSQYLKEQFPNAILAISEKIKVVQEVFKSLLNLDYQKSDGSQFDKLLKDNEIVSFGSLQMKAIPTPGHTPACMSFLFGDALFTGDALFMPDYGTGRCDFPKGSARDLYQSIIKHIYSLPDRTRIFVGHDYSPNGRDMKFETTVGESKKENIQLKADTLESDFVTFREARDKTLKAPRLLFPSLQVNINGGSLPPTEENGKSYLKIPLFLTKS